MNDVDVMVVDLDGGEMLLRCLRSLLQQTVRPARVILVDNGSAVRAADRVSGIELPFVHLRLETNSGFTGGVNAGWRACEAPFVALLNNDVELAPEWLERLREALRHDSALGATQSLILGTDMRVDGAGIAIDGGRFLQRGHGADPREAAGWPQPWGVSATAALYRRDALLSITGAGALLHPSFFAYYEDVELSARLGAAGWRCSVLSEPLAVHRASASRSRLGLRASYLQARNRHWVHRMHRVGSGSALLKEDFLELARDVRHGRPAAAASRLRGMLTGMIFPLPRG